MAARGFKYACNSHLYSQYSKKKGVIYLKCDKADCKGTAKIDQGLVYTMNDVDEALAATTSTSSSSSSAPSNVVAPPVLLNEAD